MAKFIKVAKKSEIAEQSAKCIEIEEKRCCHARYPGANDDQVKYFWIAILWEKLLEIVIRENVLNGFGSAV